MCSLTLFAWLLDSSMTSGCAPLTLHRSRDECCHTILEGAIDGNTSRHNAVAAYLRSLGALEHSPHSAAQTGNVVMIQELLLARPDCVRDTNRRVPLPAWCSQQHAGRAFAFVSNVTYRIFSCGDSPLHTAAENGFAEVARLLLEARADANMRNR